MNYVTWAIVAMGGYGVTSILLKMAMRQVPPEVALVTTNLMLVVVGAALVVHRGSSVLDHLRPVGPHCSSSRRAVFSPTGRVMVSVTGACSRPTVKTRTVRVCRCSVW